MTGVEYKRQGIWRLMKVGEWESGCGERWVWVALTEYDDEAPWTISQREWDRLEPA